MPCWQLAKPSGNTKSGIWGAGDLGGNPGFLAQFFALLSAVPHFCARQWKHHAARRHSVGLSFLVVIFAMKGVGVTRELSDILPQTMADFERDRQVMSDNLGLGRLVSGLVMFQVILLTLMGSNNSSREIAGERHIYEKEKLGGVRASSYLASKLAFLGILVTVQSTWMALFVQGICGIPTVTFWPQLALLLLVNAAMTAVCLGISALAKTADQASLLGVYLVGFQLPLSGALLALPPVLDWLTRPFISAYWSWSGIMRSLEKPFYNAVDQVTDTAFMPASAGYVVLGMHVVLGLFLAYIGVKKPRWE
ncbi:MAG: ABC transporter permease [Verrucomicrobiales bacterium]